MWQQEKARDALVAVYEAEFRDARNTRVLVLNEGQCMCAYVCS